MIREREQALQNLDNAYKAFKDISNNMQEGLKFYTDFQGVLNRFLQNCKDFVLTRSVDKKDQLAELQRAAANLQRASEPPSLPPRHGQGGAPGYPGTPQPIPQGYPQGMPPPGMLESLSGIHLRTYKSFVSFVYRSVEPWYATAIHPSCIRTTTGCSFAVFW